MAIDKKAYALANGYTDETVIGGGAIKGKNCTISKIEDINGGHRITFGWTLDNGTTKSQTLDVKDGADGYTPVKDVDYFDGQKGDKGEQGIAGIDGKDGTTYTPSIGEVTTVDSTELASATVSVNTETKEAVFNFAIPRGNKGLDGVQISDNETVENKTWSSSKIASEIPTAAKELLKYEDISSTCVFKTDAMGSNGKLPKVYKNYNSIVILWDNVVIDKTDRSANYGHIKIPKNSNYDYIMQEDNVSIVRSGATKGIARLFASYNIDDDYLYVSITGDMYTGELETGVDAVRGITTFYFIEK